MKKLLSCLLAFVMLLSLSTAALASDYSDVSDGAWYAEAVNALRERNIMNGVENNNFAPERTFTRASLATVLYRMAGTPSVSGEDNFTDTTSGTWYSGAVLWASQNGVVNGIGGGLFGTDEPTTQEQLAVMLWRDAGSYVLDREQYASAEGVENEASDWAFDAVVWAKAEALLTDAVEFQPKAAASRAQVADMVYRYLLLMEQFADVDAVSGATQKADGGRKVLVAYFSCTNHTAKIAEYIADATGGTLHQITPETPYTSADLNYNDSSTRATREQNDESARPVISGSVENMADYDVIFLGYPIWWGEEPRIMDTFAESYDFTGKTVIPFCTSGGSGIGRSESNLADRAGSGTWLDGKRFGASVSEADLQAWIDGLK